MLVLAILIVGALVGTGLDRLGLPGLATVPARFRLGLGAALLFAGLDHVLTPARYLPMLPSAIPAPELVVLLTGVAELAGALGLFVPRLRGMAGAALALYFVAVLPANVHVLLQGGSVDGMPADRAYYVVRLLAQPVFVWWALVAAELIHSRRWGLRPAAVAPAARRRGAARVKPVAIDAGERAGAGRVNRGLVHCSVTADASGADR